MNSNAKVLLDALLATQKEEEAEDLAEDEFFELFCFEQVLKESELVQEELLAGQIGGGGDGGIDGLYTFLDGALLEEDTELLDDDFDPRKVKTGARLSLVVVQAKQSASFTETAVQLLADTVTEILDLSKDSAILKEVLSSDLVARAEIFRRTWERLATRHPLISVEVFYATKGDASEVNAKVVARADRFQETVGKMNTRASASFALLGAQELLDLAAKEKSYTLQVGYQEMATTENGQVLLVRLHDYLSFISDEGSLRRHIFDWNVRDYEGRVEVNREILSSLADAKAPEFWWLNNGVTVICSRASSQGKIISLDDVQIVNGMQTSVSIFNYLADASDDDPARERAILVRVISTEDAGVRDQIIRATNRQTAVQAASLRATDPVQRELERYFLTSDWFYERRKNYYRNQGKPSSRIVPIPYLAQAVLAMGFSEPHNSRARPSSLLKRDADYSRLFDQTLDYAVYLWLAVAQKHVDRILRSVKLEHKGYTNLRFHTAMSLVALHMGARIYNPKQLVQSTAHEFTDLEVTKAAKTVAEALAGFLEEGERRNIDQVVKGREFTAYLLNHLFPEKP